MTDYGPFTKDCMALCKTLLPLYIGRAGEEIGTKIKPIDGTPVTDLDGYTLSSFRQLITSHFPNDYTIGEEDEKSDEEMKRILAREHQFQWTIDGLDGTGNLRAGTNSYGAMLSRRLGNEILASIIFRPIDMALRGNGFFFAQAGEGTWEWFEAENSFRRLHTTKPGQLERMVVMLEGGSKGFFEEPIVSLGKKMTTRPSLASCIAGTTVARGKASALVTVRNKPWDNWPPWLMVQEAGGWVRDWNGNLMTPANCANMVAAGNETDGRKIVEVTYRKVA